MRRAAYLEQVRQENAVLLVDVGGAPGGSSAYDVLRFEAILRGEATMQIAAHNLGTAEAALGAQALRDMQRKTGVPFLSANLVDSQGQPLFPASLTVTSGGLRVQIVGVTAAKTVCDGIPALEPKPAILKALRSVSPKPDRVIVLAYLPEQELQELAEQLPEVAAVIGGPTGQAIAPRSVGPTVLAAATNKGKFLVQLPLNLDSSASPGAVVELGPTFPDHGQQTLNLKRFLSELADRDFTSEQTSFAPPKSLGGSEERIAGSAACRECHAAEHHAWQASQHAHAWQTLIKKEFHVDPYCQHCHTTGYGLPGGFQSVKDSARLGGVGCESCHGPSAKHIQDSKVRTPWNASDRCVKCHDHENSPHFQYDDFWKQVRHGSETTP